jgi:hypothetical protein
VHIFLSNMRLVSAVLLSGVLASMLLQNAQASPYRLCVENIDYYPHYDFSSATGRGYAADVFALFSATTKIQLQLRPLQSSGYKIIRIVTLSILTTRSGIARAAIKK